MAHFISSIYHVCISGCFSVFLLLIVVSSSSSVVSVSVC